MAQTTVWKKRSWSRTFFLFLAAVCMLSAMNNPALGEELEMINRPVNISGLTGLLLTTSPFTVPSGSIELSAAALSEKSAKPEYTLTELPSVSITTGISNHTELTLKSVYLQKTTSAGLKMRGAGNTELTYKWNFLPQSESSSRPAVAVIVGGIAATNSKNVQTDRIKHWGARIGLSAGKEAEWGDHVIGVYADASMIIHDLSDEEQRDRYGVFNAGMLFPISKYRNLQMMIEYSVVSGVDRLTPEGGDQSSITYGLRLVNEKFNFTIGTEFIHKHEKDFDRSSRIIGMTSIKF